MTNSLDFISCTLIEPGSATDGAHAPPPPGLVVQEGPHAHPEKPPITLAAHDSQSAGAELQHSVRARLNGERTSCVSVAGV